MFRATTETVGEVTWSTLRVAIERAKHLPNIGCNRHTDSFIRLFLLPDKTKNGVRKTQVKMNNLNPVWDEEFTYENVSLDELKTARGLEVSVLKHNMLFKDDVLGCLRLGPSADVALKTLCKDGCQFRISYSLGGNAEGSWKVGGTLALTETIQECCTFFMSR